MNPTWGPIIAAAVAVVGWLVNESLATSRDLRKELRTEVDNVLETLASLEHLAIDFHTASSPDMASKIKILRGLTVIGRTLPRLQAKGLVRLHPEVATMALRRSITLENFESTFVARLPDDQLISSIMAAVGELHEQIEDAYSDRYKIRLTDERRSQFFALVTVIVLMTFADGLLRAALACGL